MPLCFKFTVCAESNQLPHARARLRLALPLSAKLENEPQATFPDVASANVGSGRGGGIKRRRAHRGLPTREGAAAFGPVVGDWAIVHHERRGAVSLKVMQAPLVPVQKARRLVTLK